MLPLAFLLCTVSAGELGFGIPVNVSWSPQSSRAPAVVAGSGEVRIVWHDFTSPPSLLYCAERAAGGWTSTGICTPNLTASYWPRATRDATGRTHLVWRDQNGPAAEIYYALRDGTGWSPPRNLSSNAGQSTNPTIAADPGGNPHVLWMDDSGGTPAIWESHFDGLLWSPAAGTGLPYVAASLADTVRIACDSTGALHAVWFDGTTSLTEVYHAVRPAGGPWGIPENISESPGELSAEPSIAIGPDDAVHCAWVEQDFFDATVFEVVYRVRPAGMGWAPLQNVSRQQASAYRPAVAVGADGSARIAWMTETTNREIWYVPAPGGEPVNLSRTPGGASDRVALTLDPDGFCHLAWEDNPSGQLEIFYVTDRPDGVLLRVGADPASGDVLLTWTGGGPLWSVFRDANPRFPALGMELTPPAGTPTPDHRDGGALRDGTTWFYLVQDRP